MSRHDVRNIVTAIHWGLVCASLVFIISVTLATPRVWPGTIGAFLMGTCTAWLFLDRHKRGGERG